jgi:hypothetical protein
VNKIAAYLVYTEQEGLTSEQGLTKVRKVYPILGSPVDLAADPSPDRRLPAELKDRINAHMIQRFAENPAGTLIEIEGASSFNAYARAQIRRGLL